jgi:acetyltransferase-like isoleucine patch superfamily enzyme
MPDLSAIDRLILHTKRGQSRPIRALRSMLRWLGQPRVLRIPRVLRSFLRAVYELHFMAIVMIRTAVTVLYRGPIFQARCASFGRNVQMDGPMPFVSGHVQILIGDDVTLGGKISIASGRMFEEPRLVVGNRVGIGWNSHFTVNREVIIEDDVRLPNCRITDSDGHPREADRRAANEPPDLRDIRPVRICRGAWVGYGCHVMKGVTIGEGAIIGANSVVITNIPPYALAMGNPAEVVMKNFGRPAVAQERQASGVIAPLACSDAGQLKN